MLSVYGYKAKKDLKASVGKSLQYVETSFFGTEYKPTGRLTVVGPSAEQRKWYAEVFMENDIIKKVT